MPVGSLNASQEAVKEKNDRDLWIALRRGLLLIVDAIERRHGLTRTAEAIDFYRFHHRPARKVDPT